jgi:hypothetical protein
MTPLPARYPLIYCALCKKQQPLLLMEMEADNNNDHAAVDLMCSECRLVIATLHERVDAED